MDPPTSWSFERTLGDVKFGTVSDSCGELKQPIKVKMNASLDSVSSRDVAVANRSCVPFRHGYADGNIVEVILVDQCRPYVLVEHHRIAAGSHVLQRKGGTGRNDIPFRYIDIIAN